MARVTFEAREKWPGVNVTYRLAECDTYDEAVAVLDKHEVPKDLRRITKVTREAVLATSPESSNLTQEESA